MLYEIGYYGALGVAAAALGIAAWQALRARRANKRREDEAFKLQSGTLTEIRRAEALRDRIDELEMEIRRRDSQIYHMRETRREDILAAREDGRQQGLREANLIRIEQEWQKAEGKKRKTVSA